MKGKKNINRVLFAGIFILLVLPMLQMQLSMVDVKPLHGSILTITKPVFSFSSWFLEDFQSQEEKYLNQNFGFRNWMVRLNNQIKFSFFKKAQANGVVIGKDNYLYEESYISAFIGKDFLGKPAIDDHLRKLKVIQDSLESHGVDIILVFAPGKASFYPEFIPDKFDTVYGISNHQYFVREAIALGINHIDFSTWFRNSKDTSKYCLYPKTGIHWSYFGMNLATDSLVKYIENLRNIDMPDLIWNGIKINKKLTGVDNDIENGMNLVFELPNFEMPYPEITIVQENKTKPKTIVIADSFYWQLQNAGYSTLLFNKAEFWFYNNTIHPARSDRSIRVKDLDLYEEVTKSDVVILMATEPVLKMKFWGFIDKLYDEIYTKSAKEEEIQSIISKIKNNKNWYGDVIEKAEKKQISIEEMLRLDAEYIYNQSMKDSVEN